MIMIMVANTYASGARLYVLYSCCIKPYNNPTVWVKRRLDDGSKCQLYDWQLDGSESAMNPVNKLDS